ncbi:TonB-dependent receptor [Qipengyuania sp.]|uniref:TonB-dependent receptor n=1 Tax=Qipengyuania sp. TaxID=2004515 RepID=UPI0035C8705C
MRISVLSRAFATTSVVVLALSTTTAMAQASDSQQNRDETSQSDAPANSSTSSSTSEPGDVIVVSGIRESLASAIDRKKNAGTTVDSIVAEDVAKFPDKNIGEALSRVTGVQLTRDFGEGVQVSIRGVEPDLNRVEVNGATTLGQGGRGNDFRELAAELIKSVDVFKGYSVDLTEGGVGGTVAITTRKPLELREPLLVASLAGQTVDTIGSWKPRATLVAGSKFLDNRIGFLVNATYDRNDTRGDFIRNTEWVRLGDLNGDGRRNTVNPNFANIESLAGCGAVPTTGSTGATRADCQAQFYDFSPRIPRYGIWVRNDERLSLDATLQGEIADNFRAYVGIQYNERNNHLTDYNRVFDLTATSRYTLGSSVTVDDNGNVIGLTTAPTVTNNASTANAGAGSIFNVEKRDFGYVQKSTYYNAGFDWNIGNLSVTGLAVNSKSTTFGDTNRISIQASPRSVRIELDPETGTPSFQFPAGFDADDISAFDYDASARALGPRLDYRPTETDNTEDQYKVDFDLLVEKSFLKSLEWGFQYREAGAVSYGGGGYLTPDGTCIPSANVTIQSIVNGSPDNLTYALPCTGTSPNPAPTFSPVWSPDRLAAFLGGSVEQTPGTFYDQPGFNRSGLQNSWLTPNFDLVSDYFDQSGFNHDCVRVCNGQPQAPAFAITEKIAAGYFKVNYDQPIGNMQLFGNFGLRVVRTHDVSSGTNIIRERRPSNNAAGFTDVTVGTQLISLENEYWDWLPAFNAAFVITPEIIARADWSQVMARPRFTDLAPNSNCLYDLTAEGMADDTLDGCSAGNPYLKPYRASQWNLNVGWYPNRDTSFSVGYYQKDISSFILSRTLVRNVNFFGDGRLFDVNQPINGTGAVQKGVEVSAQTAFTFLPSPLDGFGAIANYTYSDSSNVGLVDQLTGGSLPYPYLSRHSYNLIGYYEKYGIAARLAYNWRSRYLIAAADRSGNPVFRDGSGYLDARLGYTFKLGPVEKLEIFGEAKNLTGTAERSTAGDIRMTELAYSGRRYFFGFRAAF